MLFSLVWFGLVLGGASVAWAADVSFDVQPRLLNMGENATATITFHGTRSAPSVNLPPLDGVSVGGRSQQTQTINGYSTVAFSYPLFFSRPGTFVIGPFDLPLDGQTVVLPAVTVEVRPAASGVPGEGNGPDAIRVALETGGVKPFAQQPIQLFLDIYFLPNVPLASDIRLAGGIPDGLRFEQFQELGMERVDRDGTIYNRRRFQGFAVAERPGSYTVAPVVQVGVVEQSNRGRGGGFGIGLFDDPFFSRQTVTPHSLGAEPVVLDVRAIPTPAPAGYGGAVGSFELTARVGPGELSVGEPITVSLTLKGVGNIGTIPLPSYADTDVFKTYTARQVGAAPEPSAIFGEKTIEQVVIPRSETLTELPALELPVFDTARAAYHTLRAGPFPVVVHPATNGAQAMLLQLPGGGEGGGALIRGEDIVYIKPAPATFRAEESRLPLAGRLALFGLPPLCFLALWGWQQRRIKLEGNQAFARRQQAPRAARAGLKKARAAAMAEPPDAVAVCNALSGAVTDYFAHRLNLPPGAADEHLILAKLQQAGCAAEDLAHWREFIDIAAQVRFGGGAGLAAAALRGWVETVGDLIRRTERLRLS